MIAVEIVNDGWTRRHVGPKGVLLRRNPEHIARVLAAIHRRYDRESDMRVDPPSTEELMS